ncbi:tRNA (adenine(22)-N(1))-methyltransferase [Pseudoalteromonas tunicata]|uniref:SAM-dependent methyltransferase n=1 Tax=Pseudoalteromonas tunicata D2 TaxID=87626 RepID=A4C4Q8_9GAMM|nr:tRNA (adenine(22)-N(1))-methyltransferase TrmK [Pseudoalteromonas tunicata]ATC96981.1 tRNA (adenine22-N1)-methyltransferase [Pseudoalteromonas tunicata]AXT33104.1 SAM-dependent methyltransferase [Pseudoalteromonas tunicata]EAR30540.1 hypothetical protein PTD2_03186 [Pseudoalteromonas tunicata D2]MDP4982132.1 tRNA (adenine(22)-N(1))-methyltransferase TrmK [Pseudoalteromonas tunicata]
MKLSKRLELINQNISDNYDHIWDCCCDHGLLGAKLLTRNVSAHIHFVDLVPTILDKLTQQLIQFFPPTDGKTQWSVHCLDAALLPLSQFQAKKHLVIIAGVGGELTAKLIQQITTANPTHDIEFLLCPVHHTYQLRTQLIKLGLNLIHEQIVTENKRFYELIHVSHRALAPLSHTGASMWHATKNEHLSYLKKLILHYQKTASTHSQNTELLAYRALLSSLLEYENKN